MRHRAAYSSLLLTVAAGGLASVSTPGAASDESASPRAFHGSSQLITTQPLPGRIDDPRFDVPVDLLIEDGSAWERHVAQAVQDPQRFDGMVIGVVLDPAAPATVGGLAAAEADVASLAALGLSLDPPPLPPCARDLADPPPLGEFGTWLVCPESGTFASYFVPRPSPTDQIGRTGGIDEAVLSALNELRNPLSLREQALGYYSGLEGWPDTFRAADVDGEGRLNIDILSDVTSLKLASASVSAAFLEQVLRTALSFPAVQSVHLTLDGNCEAFWTLLEGSGCHDLTERDLQERAT